MAGEDRSPSQKGVLDLKRMSRIPGDFNVTMKEHYGVGK